MFKAPLTGIEYSYTQWPIFNIPFFPNLKEKFLFLDSEENYQKNLKDLADDWRFRDLEIDYKFNQSGLRMNKEISEVNEDYFACFGCSHTTGIGLPHNEIYSTLIEQELFLDGINVGIPGSSVKSTFLNVFYFLKMIIHKPKFMVISWPSSGRYLFLGDKADFVLPSYEIQDKHYELLYRHMSEQFIDQEANMYRSLTLDLCKMYNIKIVEFTFYNKDRFVRDNSIHCIDQNLEININEDCARDIQKIVISNKEKIISHPGKKLHREAFNFILEEINK